MQSLKSFASQIPIADAIVKSVLHLQRITGVITDIKAEVDMKRCTSVFFFFDDNDITFKDMILSEAKERGYKVTTKQFSRQGEATIITPNTSNNSISLRAWKLVYDEHKNKNKLLNEKRYGKRKR